MTQRTDHPPTGSPVHLDYDEPELGYHRVVAELASIHAPEGGSIVDLGCGPGQILSRLGGLRPDLHLVGLDGDPECLRRAALRAPGAELVVGDLETMDAFDEDRRFDLVLSSHALEHLAAPVEALHRWAALLAPGGRMVLAVPNSHQPLFLARAVARRPKANVGHFYVWDRATFHNFCRLAGFRIEATDVDYVPLVPVRLRQRLPALARAERALLSALPHFSNSHIVVLAPPGASG